MTDDHSSSRRIDVLEQEAPHLLAPSSGGSATEPLRDLRVLLTTALEDGGPTPIADALEAWRDRHPWQVRRPIERTLAGYVLDWMGELG